MISLKTKEEIKLMEEGGEKLKRILNRLVAEAKEGVKGIELENLALRLIDKEGGKPSFKMVPYYDFATCINFNEGVVHGIPSRRKIKPGDVVTIDLGIFYKGFHTDMATTFQVPPVKSKKKLLLTGEKALVKAIRKAKPGNHVGHISKVIEEEISKAGFSPVKSLTGHGIGRKLHEEPSIPCFLEGKPEITPRLKEGMALAIEVIYTEDKAELVLAQDGWTVKAKNGRIGVLFEKTIAVCQKGPLVLT